MPNEQRSLKVFLCHASQDKPKVRELYRTLRRRGIQPWLDAEDLIPGQNWEVEIPKALYSSDAIIICLSPNSVDKEGYVQKEITFALDKALEMPEGRIFLIPAKLEECELPFRLKQYQAVNLYEKEGYVKLMKALKLRASQLERKDIELPKEGKITPEINKVVEENKVDSKQETLETKPPEPARESVAKHADVAETSKDGPSAVVQLSEVPNRKLKISRSVGRVGLAFLSLTSILIFVFAFWNPLNPKGTPTSTLEIDAMTNTQAGSLDLPATDVPQTPSYTVEPSPTLTATITSTPTPLPVAITDAQSISMRLVPAGKFTMGSLADEAYNFCKTISTHIVWHGYPCRKEDYLREEPKHKVSLDSYFMDVFEVSNEEYKKCVSEGACQQPSSKGANRFSSYYDNENFLNYPVLNVNWEMAKNYCEWRGARLPTEAEWEKAARGMDERSYPWGNFGPAYELYNPDFYIDRASVNLVEFNKPTVPVTSNSKGLSPYGLHNMAGNVAEWVADWYNETYYATSPSENPPGPSSGEFKVIRGGSVGTFDVRTTARDYRNPSDFDNVIGFRCAKDAP